MKKGNNHVFEIVVSAIMFIIILLIIFCKVVFIDNNYTAPFKTASVQFVKSANRNN